MASMRSIGVKLRLDASSYKREAGEAEDATKRIGGSGVAARANLDKLTFGLGVAGAALTGFAALAVGGAMKFDKQMSEVGAVSGATADEMVKLRQAALDAGAATVFSATEAAQAEAELAKAGISTADILGGALAGALDLASAGSLTLADSATIAAAAMNTFDLSGQDVTHIADVLAAAANKSAAGVDDLGQGLQQVGLVAAQSKLSLDETVGVLAALADRGLRGSDAGTSLKTALQRLAAPTAGAKKTMDELGISMYDANGNMVDVATVAGQLQRGLQNLAPAQRNAALQTIFGSDAIRAGNVLYAEGEAGIREYIAAVDDQGAAARVAEAKLDNLAGDVEELTGSLETLFITSGSGAAGGLRTLTQAATGLLNAFGAMPGPVQSGVVILAGLAGTGLLATAGVLKLRSGIADMVESLSAVGPTGAKAAKGLSLAASAAGKAMIVFAALEAGAAVGEAIMGDLDANSTEAAKSLDGWTSSALASGEAARLFGGDLGQLADGFKRAAVPANDFDKFMDGLGNTLPGMVEKSIGDGAERIAAFDETLTKLEQNHQGDLALELLAAAAAKAGLSVDQVKAMLPGYTAATTDAAGATENAAAATTDLQRSQLGAVKTGDTLISMWERMHGTAMNADEAMLAAIEATDALKESFKENGKAIDGNSEAALKNRLALGEQAKAAYAAAEAYLANGGSAEGAQKILDDFRVTSEKAATAAGLNKDKVKALNDELYRMPPVVNTTVSVGFRIDQHARAHVLAELDRVTGMRDGGVVEHAAWGTLRQANVYSTRSPARYAFAEPATGGEAFVPKHGDYQRSLAILQTAAGWYGASVMPTTGPGAGGSGSPVVGTMVVNGTVGMSVQELVAQVTRELGWVASGCPGDSPRGRATGALGSGAGQFTTRRCRARGAGGESSPPARRREIRPASSTASWSMGLAAMASRYPRLYPPGLCDSRSSARPCSKAATRSAMVNRASGSTTASIGLRANPSTKPASYAPCSSAALMVVGASGRPRA